ncbi:MAG: hypothetical protein JXB19_11025 [Bacteroidales bacterium]|nr:hypothetical protein [Bacteroidales bacterium]
MKAANYSILLFFFIGFLLSGCEKEISPRSVDLTGQVVSHTTCKYGLKSISGTEIFPDSLTCVHYSFDSAIKKLAIKHINGGFNCCPESLYCDVSLRNDTIIIQEFEAAALCNCNCLFDLDIELFGVNSKKYQIRFIEPYAGNQLEINFEVDLTNEHEGSFCVTRKQYPWGIYSYQE